MIKLFKNEQGSALVIVLILMLVMTILGTSLLATAFASTKMTIHQENSMKAYFLAESGAKTLANHIINTPTVNIEDILISKETEPISIGGGTVTLDVQEIDSNLVISSNSIVNGVSNNATVILEKSIGNIFDYTILSLGEISIKNNVTVIGDVATNGSIAEVSSGNKSLPQEEDINVNSNISLPAIEIPSSYNQIFNNAVTGSVPITVSGDTKVHLRNGVSLSTNSSLNVTGSGTLHLYLNNGWNSDNHTKLNVDEEVTLFIYVIDSSDIFIRSNEFTGTIYAPNSIVKFNNASGSAIGGRNFLGSIIAKEVHLEGNHTTIEHDDLVDYSKIKVTKSYKIKGWQ